MHYLLKVKACIARAFDQVGAREERAFFARVDILSCVTGLVFGLVPEKIP